MKYTIEVKSLAALEVIDAYQWYDSQKEGLGLEFLDDLEILYNNLLKQSTHPIILH